MLHAAAMLCGLVILWMLASQQWSSPQAWLIAAGASFACVAVAARLGGVSESFWRAPRSAIVALSRAGAVLRGAVATIRKAVSANVALNPALVRVRTRMTRSSERAAFASLLTATPGMAVVETDADGFLMHVIDEDSIDADELGRLERATGGGAS
jgi:multisubunit Na+/H+ antiporter MnhE subunit